MKVIIVGAGLGGLACAIACRRQGFDVIVLDQVTEFLRIGDSIGFGSNSARLLYRWGVGKEMETIASSVQQMEIYQFDSSDKLLGTDRQIAESEEKYGCRQLIRHRGDFHLTMFRFATKLGVQIRMGSAVTNYDPAKPNVVLTTGEEIDGDVVIVADGVKINGRTVVLGYEDKPLHSGYTIYRSFVDADVVSDDPLI